MSASHVQQHDRVKVTLVGEGKVIGKGTYEGKETITIANDDGRHELFVLTPGHKVEHVSQFTNGAHYMDADGNVYRFSARSGVSAPGVWYEAGSSSSDPYTIPRRPLRKLVPEK